jgi:hypothetical protein
MSSPNDWEDAFGNQLSRTTQNNADLAAHYRYSPERYRLYRNGARELLQYENIGAYAHFDDQRIGDEDVFVLQPDAGDVLLFKTAERFRYTVNFVSEVSGSLAINQELSGDDRVTVGLDTSPGGDLSDGYFLEHTGDHGPEEVDVYGKRQGSVVGEKQTIDVIRALTTFQRLVLDYNWYNVGESSWGETWTNGRNGQINRDIATTSAEPTDAGTGLGGRGPISGNGHVVIEVEADASTSDLEVHAGSLSFITLGDVDSVVRTKGSEAGPFSPSQTGGWEALFAVRVAPDDENVSVELQNIDLTAGAASVVALAFDPQKVRDDTGSQLTDADFETPDSQSAANSAVEVSTSVDQFPDANGTVTDVATNPGGYQIGYGQTRGSGVGSSADTRSGDIRAKHGILDGDICVFVANPSDLSDIYAHWVARQAW